MAILLASMIAWATYLSPVTSRNSLRVDALSTMFYGANWRFITSGQGYFDHFGPQSPLLHTWSVAVEEQFYLVWPLLLLLVLRWRRRGVFALAFAGATASAIWMWVLSVDGANPDRLYYGTDTRALPLLLGCTLAALRPPSGIEDSLARVRKVAVARAGRGLIQLVGLAGMTGLVLCWLRVQDRSTWLYRGGFVVVAACAAAVLLTCTDAPRGPLARLLSLPPVRYIGAISYGLYLYHWPLFQYLTHARTGITGGWLLALRFAVTFGVAVVSYHFIEQPIRRGALSRARLRRWLPRGVAAAAVPVTSLLVIAGLITGLTLSTQASAGQIAAAGGASEPVPQVQPPPPKPPELNSAQKAALNRPIRVLIEGDSLASTFAVGFGDQGSKYHYQSYNLGLLGCGLADVGPFRDDRGVNYPSPNCAKWPAKRTADVRTYDPDVSILLAGRWEVLDRVYNGQWTHVGEAAYDNYLLRQMELAIQVLSSGGGKVLLLTTPCFAPKEAPDGSTWSFDDPARVNRYNQLLRQAAARHPGVAEVGDLDAQFCPTGTYTAAVNGVVVRNADGIHISEAGGQYAADRLEQQVIELGSPHRATEAKNTVANQAHAPTS
jgi:peptidoglycan/LPS O-acetylase OafA/YrhL